MDASGLKPSDMPVTPLVKTGDKARWRARVAVGRALFMAALIVGWSVNQAGADTVMFRFTGTVTVIDPTYMGEIGGLVKVGDTLTGMMAYDPNRTGTSLTGEVEIATLYLSPVPPGKMSYSVGGLTVTTTTSPQSNEGFHLLVGNGSLSDNAGEVSVDTFIVGSGAVRLSTTTVLHNVFRLEDTTQSVFSNTRVPTSLNLDDFDWRSFEVYKEPAGRIFETSIDTITPIDIVNGQSSASVQRDLHA